MGSTRYLPSPTTSNIVCSGQALAEQGTQISIARLLWGFHFLKAKDANGKDIDIDIFDYTNGLNWRPQPFKCVIKPRNQEIVKTIRREGEQALQDLAIYNTTTKYFPLKLHIDEFRYRMSEFFAKALRGETKE
jgi:hypothetical protein